MRTTLDLDDNLMRKIKKRAATSGKTITKVIEEALVDSLAGERAAPQDEFTLRWVTVRGRKPPRVDIADRDALYEAMEDRA